MRRRSRSSTGKRRRSSKRRPSVQPGRRKTPTRLGEGQRLSPRGGVTRKRQTISERRAARPILGRTKSSPSVTTSTRAARNAVSRRPDNRRTAVRRKIHTRKERLPALLVSGSRANENASDSQTKKILCTRKKQARRSVIIATGHGGINHQRNYRRRNPCGVK